MVLFLLLGMEAQAQYYVVDSGTSAAFTAPIASALSYSWTLDGSSVGTNNRVFTYAPANFDVGTHELIVAQALSTGGTSMAQWGVRVRIPIPTSPTKFYVSTSGSDTNNGSIGAPFKTLEAALTAIRGLSKPLQPGGVTVYLRSGTYWRTSTLTLTATDSGTPTAPIIFSSYPGETAVLSTGTALPSSAWTQLSLSETNRLTPGIDPSTVWEADASRFTNKGPYPVKYGTWPIRNSLAVTTSVPDVFYKHNRAWLSRYPNHDATFDYLTPNLKMDGIVPDITGTAYLNTSGTYLTSSGSAVPVGGAFRYYTADASHVERWKTALNKGGLWLQGFWRVTWQSDLAKVLDIDTANQVVMFAPGAAPSNGFGNKYTRPVGNHAEPYWVINLLEELDQPKEWCVDFSRNKLYFMMDGPGAPPDGSVTVADYTGPVIQISGSNVILQSLSIIESLGVGVQIASASNNLVAGCTFRNLSNMAVFIQSGSNNGVVSCNMDDLASKAIQITASGTLGSSTPDQKNYVVNGSFTKLGRYAQMYQPGVDVVSPATKNRVAHSYMYDIPHMGVQFAGYRNQYEFNDIGLYGTLVDDNGAFYSFEDFYGDDSFRFNYCHDTPLASAITYDGGTRTVRGSFYGNLSQQNASCEGQSLGVGRCSQLNMTNNISIGGGRYDSFPIASDAQMNINNNAAVAGYYPPDFVWTLYTTVNGVTTSSPTTAEVLGNGPNISYPSNPGFIDMDGQDLRLRPDAELLADMPNFKPIPFEMIGLYNDEYRSNAKVLKPFVTSYGGIFATGTQARLSGTLVYPEFDANTSVTIYYGPTDGGTNAGAWANNVNIGTVASGSFGTLVTGSASQPVYYRISATNPAGQVWSESTSAAYPAIPSSPSGLVVTAGYAQNSLTWNPATYAASYTIQRATSPGGPYVTIATGITDTTFIDTGLVTGQTYYYKVTADNAGGSSSATSAASGVPVPGTATKANNTNALSQSSSWVVGATPTILDSALWDSTFTYASVSVGSGFSAKQLQVTNPFQNFTITAGAGSITLGSGGMDLSTATKNVTIAAPITLGTSQTWTLASGRTLALNEAITDSAQNFGLTLSGSGTYTFAAANSISGGLTINPPAGGLPSYVYGGSNPSAYLRLSGTVGSIAAHGRLDVLNGGDITGVISGSGSSGYITYSDLAGQSLLFQAGSSFSMFKFGVDASSATLRSTGTAPVFFSFFGYNTASPNADYTFDGGRWYLRQIGQNNTGAQMSGAVTLTGSSYVEIQTSTQFSHGTWNVTSGTLRFVGSVSEQQANNENCSLVLYADNSGGSQGQIAITGGLTLADGGGTANTNSLTVGSGGYVYLQSGNLTLGSVTARAAETDTVNLLADGALVVNGSIVASGTVAGQTRTFNWTGGQLSAATITPGAGFTLPASGGISTSALIQTDGALAPGDSGTAGRTVINGSFLQSANGSLAIEIGGTTQATAFQTGLYDFVSCSGSASLGGNLAVSLIKNFTPTNSQTFTVCTATGGLTSALGNTILVASGTRVSTSDAGGSFRVTATGTSLQLADFLPITLITPPTSGTAFQSNPFSFTVTASGSAAISYQWRKSGSPITGATNSVYTIASPQLVSAGDYDVVLTCTSGSITSRTATLTVVTQPLAPTGLLASGGIGNIALSWDPSAGATTYNLKRSTTSGGPYTTIASALSGTTATDSSVSNGVIYYYVVSASNAAGEGANSAEAIATPASALPFGWNNRDVGTLALAGTSFYTSGTFTLKGAGSDIWGTADQFQFAYVPWVGNGTLIARVNDITNTNAWAKAAVMFRENLNANAIQVSAMLSYSNGCAFQYRSATGGASTNFAGTSGVTAPRWLKLTRSGTTYRAYQAPNSAGRPGTWASIGSTPANVNMTSGTIYAGLALTSHNTAALCTAHFDNVAFYTPPQLTLPANQVVEATGSTGAVVNFSVSGTSNIDGTLTTGATPVSGSTFPIGTSAVIVSATDTAGQIATGTFSVTVRDTTPPSITIPSNIVAEATSASGASVDFSTSANDVVNGDITPTNNPVPGSVFPIGTTTVTVRATDLTGNSGTSSFTVTVRDTTPPVITVPSDITLNAATATGAFATYSPSGFDSVSGPIAVNANPASGAFFPIGISTVVVTGSDAAGNTGTSSFHVSVVVPPVSQSELQRPQQLITSGSIRFTLGPVVPGRTYQLQRSDTLQSNSWLNVGPIQTGSTGNVILQDAFDSNTPRRFYRIQLGP